MEYVHGRPVSPVRELRDLLDIATQIAAGLQAAHAGPRLAEASWGVMRVFVELKQLVSPHQSVWHYGLLWLWLFGALITKRTRDLLIRCELGPILRGQLRVAGFGFGFLRSQLEDSIGSGARRSK